jgi:hypothetical protein
MCGLIDIRYKVNRAATARIPDVSIKRRRFPDMTWPPQLLTVPQARLWAQVAKDDIVSPVKLDSCMGPPQ